MNMPYPNSGLNKEEYFPIHIDAQGRTFHVLPRDPNSKNSAYIIHNDDGGTSIYDTVDGSSYRMPPQQHSQQQLQQWQQWQRPQPQPQEPKLNLKEQQQQQSEDKMDIDRERQVPGICFYDPIKICAYAPGPFHTSISRWIRNIREGVRYFTPEEIERFDPALSPTRLNGDEYFNDQLWKTLRGDCAPPGSSSIDDYLHRYNLARHRIFMDATIGDQGCPCECDQTPLDRYLDKNRNTYSSIGLRATVSEEIKDQMREPVEIRQIRDLGVRMRAQAAQLERDADALLGKPFPQQFGDPFGCPDYDEWTNI